TVPSDFTARVKYGRPPSLTTEVNGGFALKPVCTGVQASFVVPSPSWPNEFHPQDHTVPSPFNATLCISQPMTAFTEFRYPTFPGPCTSTGTPSRAGFVSPMPSLPKPFTPHVQTVPSDLSTMVPRAPPQTETTSAPSATLPSPKQVSKEMNSQFLNTVP